MENKKLTKKELFNMTLEVIGIAEVDEATKKTVVDFINKEIALLDKKSANRKASSVQTANLDIIENIKEVMAEIGQPVTIGQLMEDERLATYAVEENGKEVEKKMTPQKLSALITKLKKEGVVTREEIKKVAYFSLA